VKKICCPIFVLGLCVLIPHTSVAEPYLFIYYGSVFRLLTSYGPVPVPAPVPVPVPAPYLDYKKAVLNKNFVKKFLPF
jgi:hypothetical protein